MEQEALDEALNSFMFKHKGIYFQTTYTTREIVDSLEHMEIRDSDVFLVTYPKSGTIWTQQVLNLIFHEENRKGTGHIDNMARAPWIEYNLYNIDFASRQSPRLFTTHLPYHLMPKDLRFKKGKVIYVCRNPKDTMVSFFHFHRLYPKLKVTLDWETFFDLFLCGKVTCGSWFDHVKGWYTHKEEYNILFMTYEEMKKDLRSAVMKICNFVDMKLDKQAVDIVVEKSSFKNMRHDPLANYEFISNEVLDFTKGNFFRKGTVGDWKTRMTVAQSKIFDSVYKEKMKDAPIKFLWDINDEEASLLE